MSVTMIGLDTAKSVFQIHGVNETGKVEIKRKLRRSELIAFFEKHESCTVVMEACGAAHHWARMLTGLGHEVKLIAPEAVKPFVKKGKKNDAADAAAICEAASRSGMKFVPAKNVEQQASWPCMRPDPYWSSSRRCWQTPCAAWRRNSASPFQKAYESSRN
jgi:transposase